MIANPTRLSGSVALQVKVQQIKRLYILFENWNHMTMEYWDQLSQQTQLIEETYKFQCE